MANLKSSIKDIRRTKGRTFRNNKYRIEFDKIKKDYIKSPNAATLSEIYSKADKMVKIHIFHKNKAAREKSKLTNLLNVK